MKKRQLMGVMVLLVGLSTSAFADESHHKDDDGAKQDHSSHGTAMSGMGNMHGHMKKMREIMADIHDAGSKEERQALMKKHMKAMHEGMNMMAGMGGAHDGKNKECAEMMEKRMKMMQGMMEQMNEHMVMQSDMSMDKK